MKILGEGNYVDVKGRRHHVEGIRKFSDDTLLKSLKVSGTVSFEKISCDTIEISGECSGDSLTAKNLFVEGTLKVRSVNVTEKLTVEGSLNVSSVAAMQVFIESQTGSVDEVKCKQIKIFNNDEFVTPQRLYIYIKNIDAEKVELKNCKVEVIRCKNAFIGSNCAIEKLFVAGECKVAPDSTVGETIFSTSDS